MGRGPGLAEGHRRYSAADSQPAEEETYPSVTSDSASAEFSFKFKYGFTFTLVYQPSLKQRVTDLRVPGMSVGCLCVMLSVDWRGTVL